MLSKNSAKLFAFLLYLMREASSLPETDATHPLLYSVFGGGKKVGWGVAEVELWKSFHCGNFVTIQSSR